MIVSVFLGDVGVIGCTLKVIVPINQLYMIMCESIWCGEIIQSSGGPCHLSTISLKNSHMFKIAELVISFYSHVSNIHNMRHLCTLAMFHTHHVNSLLLLIHVQVQCDLAITKNTCIDKYSLNYLNLFLKYKIG